MHLAKKCGTGIQKAAENLSKAIRRMYIWLSRKMDTGALLMRNKDANLRLTKKCGAGFHKAAQYQPDITVFVQLPALDQAFKARAQRAPQGCKLALDQEVRHWLSKSSSVSEVFVYQNQSTYLRIGRALLMHHKGANLHLTKKCGTGFQKEISRMSLYMCLFDRET